MGIDYNQRKGIAGEHIVSNILRELTNNHNSVWAWNDVNILGAQIDHLVLYWTGLWFRILVIETKNWSGVIKGEPWQTYWCVESWGKVSKRYNPILQNRKHCTMVRMLFFWCGIKSIIVFVGNCKYPKVEYWQCGAYIFDVEGLKIYLGMS